MDAIIKALVDAGYFRARINTLSEFDKIIGGMAWAMQVFSHDININIFYADTLDLGQKIALTERLVMVLLVVNCPYQIEPHQIVGLDYVKLLPMIQWLIKRSSEIRREHEAFNRLQALRYFFRVTDCSIDRSLWCHIINIEQIRKSERSSLKAQERVDKTGDGESKSESKLSTIQANANHALMEKINQDFKSNQRVSFVRLPILYSANQAQARQEGIGPGLSEEESSEEEEEEEDKADSSTGTVVIASEYKTKNIGDEIDNQNELTSELEKTVIAKKVERSPEEVALHKELDTELLATNQKILNLSRKLDSMPSQLEISQYQKRYIELHQQLICKNKDLKKLYALFNSLDSIKHYLTKEINLLESIMSNLDLTIDSATNKFEFLRQFEDIISKIQSVRDDVIARLDILKDRCNALNVEYVSLSID